MTAFDPAPLRSLFPALSHSDAIFFDNPGGTQVPQSVIDATVHYYSQCNANIGGAFPTSQRTDAMLKETRQAMADFLNAPSPETLVFGANMTTLTFHLARSIAETIKPGDEIVITTLDHDANVAPWTDLEAAGAVIRVAEVLPDGTLDRDSLQSMLSERTRLVAVTHASNAVGSVPDVAAITEMAHAVGAWVFVDAVQYAPHGPIDVQKLDCDFLACSAYKFFGPHLGVLYGKAEHLANLRPHKVRPAKDSLPYRWETGTQNHEGMAACGAALGYLAEIGERFGAAWNAEYAAQGYSGRRLTFKTAMRAILEYEKTLSHALIRGLQTIPGLTLYGPTDTDRLEKRIPTLAFTWNALPPRETTERLAAYNVYCWSGNYYALRLMEHLNLETSGGAVRIGLAHYNTLTEIERLITALREIQASA